jgi:hypothetical protein
MNSCKSIRELIDEADNPNLLPFEVSQHVGACRDCERFSAERAGLRRLLGSGARVAAPMNFDAMLAARLAETRNRGSISWLVPVSYLRLGAATAGLAVMVMVAQYAGVFSTRSVPTDLRHTASATNKVDQLAPNTSPPTPGNVAQNQIEPPPVMMASGPRIKGIRNALATSARVSSRESLAAEDPGVVLVRGRNGDSDVQMPTVSLGAQPLLYVSAGKQPVRTVGTSF